MLTLPEIAVLVELETGPKNLAELSAGAGELAIGIGLTVMHLEQAGFVIGYGLPRSYALSDAGRLALTTWFGAVKRLEIRRRSTKNTWD